MITHVIVDPGKGSMPSVKITLHLWWGLFKRHYTLVWRYHRGRMWHGQWVGEWFENVWYDEDRKVDVTDSDMVRKLRDFWFNGGLHAEKDSEGYH